MSDERSCENCGDEVCRSRFYPLDQKDMDIFKEPTDCDDWIPRPDGDKR